MGKLEKLFEKITEINEEKYYNILNVRTVIKINPKQTFDEEGGVIFNNEEDEKFRKKNPYWVEIIARVSGIYWNKFTNKKAKELTIAQGRSSTIEKALEIAIESYEFKKKEFQNKNYEESLYKRSLRKGYKGSLQEWRKDIDKFNADRKEKNHIIEMPEFDEQGNLIKEGIYKKYPKGINYIQDKKDAQTGKKQNR